MNPSVIAVYGVFFREHQESVYGVDIIRRGQVIESDEVFIQATSKELLERYAKWTATEMLKELHIDPAGLVSHDVDIDTSLKEHFNGGKL